MCCYVLYLLPLCCLLYVLYLLSVWHVLYFVCDALLFDLFVVFGVSVVFVLCVIRVAFVDICGCVVFS